MVEHPELIAWRIKNFARLVGKENVVASADCGFSQDWEVVRVHPSIQWAKLQSLVDGAALASMELWADPSLDGLHATAAATAARTLRLP